jgi:hypothetical protein
MHLSFHSTVGMKLIFRLVLAYRYVLFSFTHLYYSQGSIDHNFPDTNMSLVHCCPGFETYIRILLSHLYSLFIHGFDLWMICTSLFPSLQMRKRRSVTSKYIITQMPESDTSLQI